MSISNVFKEIMDSYLERKKKEIFNSSSELYQLINYESKKVVENVISNIDLDSFHLQVKASCGAGNWTRYPWIAIFNTNITGTIQEGVYIVYLFSEDMHRVYLTLNQGCTNLKKNLGTKSAKNEMERIRENIRKDIANSGFNTDNDLDVGNKDYEYGSVFYKEYNSNDLPSDEDMANDLFKMINVYKAYFLKIFKGEGTDIILEDTHAERPLNKEIIMVKKIQNLKDYINSKGFIYTNKDLSNFYLSLKTKPFVILAGTSGTGKSKLVRLFAEAIGATKDNGRFNMISVKPDWNDSTELLGYKNINEEFVPGKLTNIIHEASMTENKDKPYFICLDEMNLARVEYYLSDYLSLIESREVSHSGEIITDNLFSKDYLGEDSPYSNLCIPENIYIVGTVNMDDTTFAFSRKVLDRANTIEFSDVDLDALDFSDEECESINVDNSFLRTSFLNIKDALNSDDKFVRAINSKVKDINEILELGNKKFGYRVRDEIVFYMLENKINNLLSEDEAFDFQIMQKILPTITGSELLIKDTLIKLFNYCSTNDKEISATGEYIKNCETELKSNRIKYKKSAKKILMMLRGYEDGFTSFWS
jgi:5-methylcytosine-specific restriction protein B